MYAIKLNRDDILIEDFLVEQILEALPRSFKYKVSLSPLQRGKIIAENGHGTISLQIIADDLWLFVTPKNASGIAFYDCSRNYCVLIDRLSELTLDTALPA